MMTERELEAARVRGTQRYRHVTQSGLYLEKSIIYMRCAEWRHVYSSAAFLGISPSMYLSLLVNEDEARHTSRLKGEHELN